MANVNDIRADAGKPAIRGVRLTVKPERFVLSVKKDDTAKTIKLFNTRVVIENADMARETGFPVGSVIACNAYLPLKKANKEQAARALRNYDAEQAAKRTARKQPGETTVASLREATADAGDDDSDDDDAGE